MFNQLYEQLKGEDIFKPKTEEEVVQDILIQAKATKNKDGSYNTERDIDLSRLNLTKIPVKFRYVGGNFYCDDNKLISLEGAPEEVGEDFWCFRNELTSLKDAPKEVGGTFDCDFNYLTSLEGAPREVGRNFYCNGNKLTTLEGIGEVRGSICCEGNSVSGDKLLKTIGRL